jgi:hypothetical protein
MDKDHATTTLPSPLQLGITATASLCIIAAQCRQSTNFSNDPCIEDGAHFNLHYKVLRELLIVEFGWNT